MKKRVIDRDKLLDCLYETNNKCISTLTRYLESAEDTAEDDYRTVMAVRETVLQIARKIEKGDFNA